MFFLDVNIIHEQGKFTYREPTISEIYPIVTVSYHPPTKCAYIAM